MPGPWEKYKTAPVTGPWVKYSPSAQTSQTAAERASKAVRGVFAMPSLKEAVLSGPSALLPGLGAAQTATTTAGIEASKDPRAIPAAIRVAVPAAAGFATFGVGALPAIGAMGLAGAGGEASAQLAERMTGSPDAPKTSLQAAKQIATAGAANAAGEGLFRGIAKGVMALPGMLVGRGAKLASKTGAPAEDLQRIYQQHPEVTKPGYFNERIDTFGKDVVAGLDKKRAAASNMFENAKSAALKPAGRNFDLQELVDKRIVDLDLSADTGEASKAVKTVKKLMLALNKRGDTFSFKDIATLDRALFDISSSPSSSNIAKKFTRDIASDLNKFYDTAPASVKKARDAWKEYVSASETLQTGLGVVPKKEPGVLSQTGNVPENVSAFLSLPDEASKDAVRKATDYISPSLTNRLEKLSAAGPGEGRLSSNPPAIPTVGLGQAGYAAHNPASAAAALPILAAAQKVKSASFAGRLVRGAKAVEPYLPSILPGAYRTGRGLIEGVVRGRKK